MSRSVVVVLAGVLVAMAHCIEDTSFESRFMNAYRDIRKMFHLEDDHQDLNADESLMQRMEGIW